MFCKEQVWNKLTENLSQLHEKQPENNTIYFDN